jgi:hypothetical protein
MFEHFGIKMEAATELAPEILAPAGWSAGRKPSGRELADIEFGWKLAKEMGRLDVGQSVAVKDRAALAVEALEGTDECIRRAGQLCPAGGFCVVKVAKPAQDMRFDVPTVGIQTLQTLHTAGGSVLAIEAERTIVLNPAEVLSFARHHHLALLALNRQ